MEEQKFREYQKSKKRAKKTERKIFTIENLLVLLLGAVAIGSWVYFGQKYVQPELTAEQLFQSDRTLKVVFFDVGQGDAALITTPGGKNILIDAGSIKGATIQESDEGEFITEIDAAESVILPYFQKNNITKLDALIITHPHVDHFGGAIKILDSIPVKLFVDNGIPRSNPHLEELLRKVRAKRIRYFTPSPGDILPLKEEDFELRFLTTPVPFAEQDHPSINNSSLVARLRYKNFTVLFTGDIEVEAELEILNWGEKLRSTILKVAHHGSQSSSTLPFLDMVAPSAAVISCGRENPYGHPHDVVIERLNRLGVKVYRTDELGTITFLTDGFKYAKK